MRNRILTLIILVIAIAVATVLTLQSSSEPRWIAMLRNTSPMTNESREVVREILRDPNHLDRLRNLARQPHDVNAARELLIYVSNLAAQSPDVAYLKIADSLFAQLNPSQCPRDVTIRVHYPFHLVAVELAQIAMNEACAHTQRVGAAISLAEVAYGAPGQLSDLIDKMRPKDDVGIAVVVFLRSTSKQITDEEAVSEIANIRDNAGDVITRESCQWLIARCPFY